MSSTLHMEQVRPAGATLGGREKTLLGVMVAAAFTVLLNETLLSIALPTLMRDLSISAATGTWLTTAFMLTMAVVTPMGGTLIGRFSIRAAFTGAMGIFLGGTGLAAAAPGFGVLLTGRVLQAAATAVMIPLLMTTVLRIIPAERRGMMLGVVGLVISAAPAAGPAIAGVVLSVLSWRWLFLLVIPVAAVASVAGLWLIPRETERRTSTGRLDLVSAVLSALGFGGLVLGVSGADAEAQLVDPRLALVVGVVSLMFFVRRQLAAAQPFLDLAVLRRAPYLWAMLTSSTVMAVMLGISVVLPLYTQNVLGVSTTTAGLLVMPGALATGLLGPVVGALSDRLSLGVLALPGAAMLLGGVVVMAGMGQGTSLVLVVAAHVLMSLGVSLLTTPLNNAGLGSLDDDLYAHGTSLMTTVQQVCGAGASALFVAIMSGRITDAAGLGSVAAQAAGTHAAFVAAVVMGLATLFLTVLTVRRVPARA